MPRHPRRNTPPVPARPLARSPSRVSFPLPPAHNFPPTPAPAKSSSAELEIVFPWPDPFRQATYPRAKNAAAFKILAASFSITVPLLLLNCPRGHPSLALTLQTSKCKSTAAAREQPPSQTTSPTSRAGTRAARFANPALCSRRVRDPFAHIPHRSAPCRRFPN